MTRTVLILGLILLAALLPLAAVLLTCAAFVIGTLPAVTRIAARPAAGVQPVALLALTFFRAPPAAR